VATLVGARRAVLLDAGGFERNPELRAKYSRQPNSGQWTFGNSGNTGEVLVAAMSLGAKTDLLDEAWWNPVPIPELFGSTLPVARNFPRTILVNKAGEQFCNESNSYVEVGIAHHSVRRLYTRATWARAVAWYATSPPRFSTTRAHPSSVSTRPVT
jgi:3-oxosteroid 1-dehydrogenase